MDPPNSTLLEKQQVLEPGGNGGRKRFHTMWDARGISQAKQTKALLLHTAGMNVQDLFEILTDPGHPKKVTPDPHNV